MSFSSKNNHHILAGRKNFSILKFDNLNLNIFNVNIIFSFMYPIHYYIYINDKFGDIP